MNTAPIYDNLGGTRRRAPRVTREQFETLARELDEITAELTELSNPLFAPPFGPIPVGGKSKD